MKKQDRWATELSRFAKAGGLLYDLEFLVDDKGARIAAFGFSAGFSGALGRCGKGATECCLAAGIPENSILKWDMAETSRGGPFSEIANTDVLLNCVYLGAHRIPPFTTLESLSTPERRLRVICDASCDPDNKNNPIPVYSGYSSFNSPTISASGTLDGPELRIIAIDYLLTMIACEASDEYAGLLLPSLLKLRDREKEGVWTRAEHTYRERVSELP